MSGWLILAPHLDDAALTCGGALAGAADRGERVTVATVFAGDPDDVPPAARSFHRDCALPDDRATQLRRAEDRRACEILGVDAVHLPLVDAIYRRLGERWLAEDSADVLSARAADDPDAVSATVRAISELVGAVRPERTWACAALSPHVDHEIVRLAALDVLGPAVALWEDPPMVGPERESWAPPAGWVRSAVAVSASGWRRQIDAVAAYTSQVTMLFGDDDVDARLAERLAHDGHGSAIVGVWSVGTSGG